MIKQIAVDADDTLWDEASRFLAAEDEFVTAVEAWTGGNQVRKRLREMHFTRLDQVGYGASAYQLVLGEFSRTVLPHSIATQAIELSARLCADLLAYPVTPLSGVAEALELLQETAELILVTKGEESAQRYKLESSGLTGYFSEVHIVKDKKIETYARIFGPKQSSPHAAMIGNSIKSDIVPSIAAGALGIYIPHTHDAPLEMAEKPTEHPYFRKFSTILEAARWLQNYQSRFR